ncbi:MAG: leucine-rich repeat protein [Clostridiales bacterium]|nr:leucine-rich repeat protein [Candidatus Equinaster intestinalis]
MKKWLSIVLAVCLIAAAIPFGMLSASAAAPVWVRGDDGTAVKVGDVIPKGVGVKVQGWVDGSGEQNILINGAGGMTTKGLFTFRSFAPLRIDALTPKLTVTAIYNIVFDTDGGTLSDDNTYTVGGNEKFPTNLPTASKEGAKFLGWKYDGALINANTKVGQYVYSSSVTLTASYEVTEKVTGEDTWSLSGTVLTISGNGKMADYTASNKAPWGTDITKVIMGEGVKNIGSMAFANCSKLTEVQVSSTVATIDTTHTADTNTSAFQGCTALEKITVASGNSNFASDNGVLYNKAKTTLILCPAAKTGSYTVASTATKISDFAFENSKLSSISMPAGVKTLGLGAFSSCNNITSMEVPKGVTSTTSYVFYFCEKLTTLTIHKELTSIGAMFAFGSPITDVYYDGSSSQKNTLLSKVSGLWTCIDYPIVSGKPDVQNPVAWHIEVGPIVTGYTISGTVTSYANTNIETGSVTVSISAKGSTEVIKTATVTGTSGTYSLTDIAAGTYNVTFKKPGHSAHTEEVTVSSANVTIDVALRHLGDADGNGKTNKTDVAFIKDHINRVETLTGLDFEGANITGDSKVNKSDLALMKDHVNRTEYLY